MKVYLAEDDRAVYWIEDTGYLIMVVNEEEPPTLPQSGNVVVSTIYGKHIDEDTNIVDTMRLVLNNEIGLNRLAQVYRDLDTSDTEYHLYISEDLELVIQSLDLINMEGFQSIGSFHYYTEFDKICFLDVGCSL